MSGSFDYGGRCLLLLLVKPCSEPRAVVFSSDIRSTSYWWNSGGTVVWHMSHMANLWKRGVPFVWLNANIPFFFGRVNGIHTHTHTYKHIHTNTHTHKQKNFFSHTSHFFLGSPIFFLLALGTIPFLRPWKWSVCNDFIFPSISLVVR